MIKELKKYQIQITPFNASKTWNLNNVDNGDSLLFESTSSNDGLPIGFEFYDYSTGTRTNNYSCSVALEQQSNDLVIYQEGLKLSGPFYPDLDPQNVNGTYKRVVYSQIKTAFYNDFRDPTKILGLENIDFENSRNKRYLTDRLKVFDISRNIFGDKIIPNTVTMYETLSDNDYVIVDDGYGNLYAGRNLFSDQQEIGQFLNSFLSGSNDGCCAFFGVCAPTTTTTTTPAPPPCSSGFYSIVYTAPSTGGSLATLVNTPAGTYTVIYLGGCVNYNGNFANVYLHGVYPVNGLTIFYNNGIIPNAQLEGPIINRSGFITKAQVEAANAGASTTFYHFGGHISFEFPAGADTNTMGNSPPSYIINVVC